MLSLGTGSFPQATGANTGGSAQHSTALPGNDPPNGAEESRAHIHIALFEPFKTGTCLSKAILDLLCTHWLLASLPGAISLPKI